MGFIDEIKAKAKSCKKTIVLPESEDIRTYEAAEAILKEGTANLILIGSEEEIAKSAIAYEPIWAIGTGKTCDSDEANRVIAMIRNVVKTVSTEAAADSIRILYGGSVKPATIEEQMMKSDIDGALIGGASMKVDSFSEIIEKTK